MPQLAIAKLMSAEGAILGTAFAVSRYLAITAFHCIAKGEEVIHRKVTLCWRGGPLHSVAEFAAGDFILDYALFEIRPPILDAYDLKPLNVFRPSGSDAELRDLEFRSEGFPADLDKKVNAPALFGRISSYSITIKKTGAPAVQLFCPDATNFHRLQGYSGAPAYVGSDHALGLIRWNPTLEPGDLGYSEASAGMAIGAMICATSIQLIADARPLFFRDANFFRYDPQNAWQNWGNPWFRC
jgi:hypothetical protein